MILLLGKLIQVVIGLFQSFFIASYFPSDSISNYIVNLPVYLLILSTDLHYDFYRAFKGRYATSFMESYSHYISFLFQDICLSVALLFVFLLMSPNSNFIDSILLVLIVVLDKIADELQRFWLIAKKNFGNHLAVILSRRVFLLLSVVTAFFLHDLFNSDARCFLLVYLLLSLSTLIFPLFWFNSHLISAFVLIKPSNLHILQFSRLIHLFKLKGKALIVAFSAGQLLILARFSPQILPRISSVKFLMLLQISTAIYLIPTVLFSQRIRYMLVTPRPRQFYLTLILKAMALALFLNLLLLFAIFANAFSLIPSYLAGLSTVLSYFDSYSFFYVLVLSLSLILVAICSCCNEWLYDVKARITFAVLSFFGSLCIWSVAFVFKDLSSPLSGICVLLSFLVFPLINIYKLLSFEEGKTNLYA